MSNVLEPISHPEWYRSLGLEVPAGVLFFGPPGWVLSYEIIAIVPYCCLVEPQMWQDLAG